MPTVLLTGSEGFLGRHIVSALVVAGWRVVGLDRIPASSQGALSEYHLVNLPAPAFDDVLKVERPDALVHAAGPASVGDSLINPALDFDVSVSATFGTMDAVRRIAPSCHVLFLSSAAVYGNPPFLPIGEADPTRPLSPYGFHKSLCERLMEEFWAIYRVPTVSLRIFSAYGPGLRRQVMWDLCRKIRSSEEVELFGTGEETRDFVHARDVGRAVALLLNRASFNGEAYNLAAGEETRIRDLAALIAHELGRSPRLRFLGKSRPGDPLRWQADISRIRALGYQPGIALKDGVAEYVRWVINL